MAEVRGTVNEPLADVRARDHRGTWAITDWGPGSRAARKLLGGIGAPALAGASSMR